MEQQKNTIQIHITEEDYWHLNKTAILKMYGIGMLIAVVALPILTTVIFMQMGRSLTYSIIASLLLSAFVDIYTYLRTKGKIKKLARQSKGILGDQQLEITASEIRWSNDMTSGTTQWQGLESFQETKAYYFIFINKASAHIVPKRSFQTEAEAAGFAQQVRTYMQAAK